MNAEFAEVAKRKPMFDFANFANFALTGFRSH